MVLVPTSAGFVLCIGDHRQSVLSCLLHPLRYPATAQAGPDSKNTSHCALFFLFLTLLAIFIDNQWVCGKFRFPKLRKSCALLLTCFPPVTLNYFNVLLSHQFFFQNYSSYNRILERAKGSFMIVRFWGYDRNISTHH